MSSKTDYWVKAKVGEIMNLVNGAPFKPSDWAPEGLPIIRIQNLNNRDARFNYFNGQIAEKFRVKTDDLLFAWSGTPGTSFGAHIWKGGDAWLNQHIFRVDFDRENLNSEFLRLAINQNLADYVRQAHGGAGLAHITKGKFEDSEVFLPPLNEQRRIVAKLDALFEKSRAIREKLDRAPRLLANLQKSILNAAFRGDLTQEWRRRHSVPNLWRETTIGDVADVGTGSTPLRSKADYFADVGVPWVTSAATGSLFVREASEFVTDAAVKDHRLKIYPSGTLLVAMYGEGKTRGQVTELSIDATINQACAAIQVDESIALRSFVKFALLSNYLAMRAMAEGGNQPNLNLSKVRDVSFLAPDIEEQHEVVRLLSVALAGIQQLTAKNSLGLSRLAALEASTLDKAFRGELVPQDPNDEPARLLLERICSQKLETKPKRRGSKAAAV